MAAEERNGGGAPSENPTKVDHSFDDLARAVAEGSMSRRRALKLFAGTALAALIPSRALADDDDCVRVCHVPFDREKEECDFDNAVTRCVSRRERRRHLENHPCDCRGRCANCLTPGACAPPECGSFTPCGGDPSGLECFCFEVTETPGQGRCLSDFFCDDAVACPNGQIDCPTGFTCVTNSCCGEGVQLCTAECGAGVTSQVGQSGGPTGSGVPH
jgi:hypothetical protein